MHELGFGEGWNQYFDKLDKNQKDRIWKKIMQLKELQNARHLKLGVPFFIVETGQYRISLEEAGTERIIRFAGTHKQYEKWYKQFF